MRTAKSIMMQSTLSGSGKSLVTAAICRHLSNEGYNVSPFKSLNISLNSYITPDGSEIGISQAFQAWACGKEPCHQMNPILLKATGNRASQTIINGMPQRDFDIGGDRGWDYLVSTIKRSYEFLSERNDMIVIEGSGSPAEINLRDIANMTTAELTGSPVVLIGDIDTGGVFAGLYGTYHLLEQRHKKYVKGFIINKFRGECSILGPGIRRIENEMGAPCLGVVRYHRYGFPAEDSLSMEECGHNEKGASDIRELWLNNLDLFLEKMENEIDIPALEDIMERGV